MEWLQFNIKIARRPLLIHVSSQQKFTINHLEDVNQWKWIKGNDNAKTNEIAWADVINSQMCILLTDFETLVILV